jgi:eukaryotic-like serine/threonine-protein kinase
MTASRFEKCPTLDQWSLFLASDAIESTACHQHIEECASCRAALESLVVNETFVDELHRRLGCNRPTVPQLSGRILALSGERTGGCTETWEAELAQLRQRLEPASHPELIGLLGRYELHQLIGRGGMGLVFRARDLELQRIVAVKTLSLHLASLGTARERFAREGRAVASLAHPHIVQVYDVITDHAIPALVMQYVPGETLEERIQSQGRLPIDDAMRIASQVLDALAAAHASGLVHRDIKPGNVLLEADGSRGLLSDFGLVRALDDASLTHSGFLAGTPHYMAPEQARGETVDARSDLFSFGGLVYTMLAGHPPFRAPEPMAVLHRVCSKPHRPLHQLDGRIPLELSRWVDRLLAKDPSRRFASASAARSALQHLEQAPRRLLRSMNFETSPVLRIGLVAAASLLFLCGWLGTRHIRLGRAPAWVSPAASSGPLGPLGPLGPAADAPPATSLSQSGENSTSQAQSNAKYLAILAAGTAELLQAARSDALDAQLEQLEHDVRQVENGLQPALSMASFKIKAAEQALWELQRQLDQLQRE